MKEALELVKVHMGPEAIILSAKDSHRGFGLMGERSVEVTAAVSEETLRKKKIAESRLREELRERFNQIPATKQKEFINKAFDRAVEKNAERRELAMAGQTPRVSAESRAQVSGMRYIDIPDDQEDGRERVRRAAEAARSGMAAFQEPKPRPAKPKPKAIVPQAAVAQSIEAATGYHQPSNHEVVALQNQVRELKNLVEKFQTMPQIPCRCILERSKGYPLN